MKTARARMKLHGRTAGSPLRAGAGAGAGTGRKESPRTAARKANAQGQAGRVALDPLIHERTRLAILTTLATSPDAARSFLDLREELHLTDGNLMAHLRTLEQAGLVARTKKGKGRGSHTTVALSHTGRVAFGAYLDQLEALLQTARGPGGSVHDPK